MQSDFHDAHHRHWQDAEQLFDAGRWANADHFYGMAADRGFAALGSLHARLASVDGSEVRAIFGALEDSSERYPNYSLALHYESIKRGIQKASEIRVDEMAEDYPWVRTFLTLLSGLTVPCEFDLVLQRWQDRFPNGPIAESGDRLPPQHAERGWEGVREDLLRLGLFELKKDGRIDMPDLYRVGFGLGRRGGVKPKKA